MNEISFAATGNLTADPELRFTAVVQGTLVTKTYTPSEGPRAGENLSRLEVEIHEIGPSLRWGTAQLTKPSRQPDHEPSA